MGHLDARTTTTRRLRRGMALAACTALLGLTACGAGDEAGTPTSVVERAAFRLTRAHDSL